LAAIDTVTAGGFLDGFDSTKEKECTVSCNTFCCNGKTSVPDRIVQFPVPEMDPELLNVETNIAELSAL